MRPSPEAQGPAGDSSAEDIQEVGMLAAGNVSSLPFQSLTPTPAFLPLLFLPRSAKGTPGGVRERKVKPGKSRHSAFQC